MKPSRMPRQAEGPPRGLIILALAIAGWAVIVVLAIALIAVAGTVSAEIAPVVRLLGVQG